MTTLTLQVQNLPAHVEDFIENAPHKKAKTVRVHLGNDPQGFGTTWSDYVATTTYLVKPEGVKVIRGAYNESLINEDSLTKAIYVGDAKAHIEGAQFIACYSSGWDVYLPANALDGIPSRAYPELNPGEKVVLYLAVSLKSQFRVSEAAKWGMGSKSYARYVESLQKKGLIASNKAATPAGKEYRDNVLGISGSGLEDAWKAYAKAGYPGEGR